MAPAPSETWQVEHVLTDGHDRTVYGVAWSEYGIASCGSDGRIIVWCEDNGAWVQSAIEDFAHGQVEINSICWGPGGKLYTAGDDGVINVWQYST